jgi:hypothetical protein
MRFFHRHQRFPVPAELPIDVKLEWLAGDGRPAMPANLRAIGPTGFQLASDRPVPLFQPFMLTVSSQTLDVSLSSLAHASLSRAQGETHLSDCVFQEEIPGPILEKLVSGGGIDGRQYPRLTVSAVGVLTWELDPKRHPVRIEDLSRGGMRLSLDVEPPSVGTRLLLHLEAVGGAAPEPIRATVTWKTQSTARYEVGCRFIDERSYFDVQDHVATPEPEALPIRSLRQSIWVPLLSLAALALIITWLIFH